MSTIRLIALCIALLHLAEGLAYEKDELYARVVDVGAGECCVIKLPGNKHVVYDAGNWRDGGQTAIAAIRNILGKTKTIDLLVISHTDSDHLGVTCPRFMYQSL